MFTLQILKNEFNEKKRYIFCIYGEYNLKKIIQNSYY